MKNFISTNYDQIMTNHQIKDLEKTSLVFLFNSHKILQKT